MLASSDSAYWNELHGSLSVTFNVVASTTAMSFTSAMYTPDDVLLRGQTKYFAQSLAGRLVPTRWRLSPNATASAS